MVKGGRATPRPCCAQEIQAEREPHKVVLLMHDLNNTASAAHPETKLANPLMLLAATAADGGLWKCAYTSESIGKASFVLGHFKSRVVRNST